ncbi:MAG: hypothetical protein ACERKZ_19465 [Lachnotalea sp.]
MKVIEPEVPQEIKEKIEKLNRIIQISSDLRNEITEWYHQALLNLDFELDVEDELFARQMRWL